MPIDQKTRLAKLSEFDRRIASGLKVTATGPVALDMTPNEAEARGWLFRVTCSCGRRTPLSNRDLIARGLGETKMRHMTSRLVCKERRCKGPPVIETIDPCRDALDRD